MSEYISDINIIDWKKNQQPTTIVNVDIAQN